VLCNAEQSGVGAKQKGGGGGRLIISTSQRGAFREKLMLPDNVGRLVICLIPRALLCYILL